MHKKSILSILPFADNAQLIDKKQKLTELCLTLLIVDFSIIALRSFLKGNLIDFDAQVGENLCQIRAYRILILAKKWLDNSFMKQKFQKQMDYLINYQIHLKKIVVNWEKSIQHSTQYDKNLDAHESLSEFFARMKLEFDLCEELTFIISCCFLTHFNIKEEQIPIAIDLDKIASEFNISKYKAKRLSHHYQQVVCKSGCNFIMQIANDLPSNNGYKEILSNLFKIADEDRAVLPCYIVSEIIFNHAVVEKIPLLLKIKRFNMNRTHYDLIYFHLIVNEGSETEFSLFPCSANFSTRCMVVSGEVHDNIENPPETTEYYICRVLDETPLKLILANTAIHPQYSGKRLEFLRENPFRHRLTDFHSPCMEKKAIELAVMQDFALKDGCSRQNPTTFYLKHIYANTLLNEINKLKFIHTGCAFKVLEDKSVRLRHQGHVYAKSKSALYESI